MAAYEEFMLSRPWEEQVIWGSFRRWHIIALVVAGILTVGKD